MAQLMLLVGLAISLAWGEKAVTAPGILSVASIAELEETLAKLQGKPTVVRVRADWNHWAR